MESHNIHGAVSTAQKQPTMDELMEGFVAKIPTWTTGIDEPDTQEHINRQILLLLRGVDYVGRQRLVILLGALRADQYHNRPDSRDFAEPLPGLVPLIEAAEQEIVDEEFNQRLLDAVARFPRDRQRGLLEVLEAANRNEADATIAARVTDLSRNPEQPPREIQEARGPAARVSGRSS